MRSALVVTVMLAVGSTTLAAPRVTSNARVVLADPDPELLHAITAALAPWHLEVVVDATAPSDAADATNRATRADARFVVWRRNGELVVFDRDRAVVERRDGLDGVLDPISAAAAALTVKTLMRLPPPVEESVVPEVLPPSTPENAMRIRVQAGISSRVTHGSSTDLGARGVVAGLVRPWAARGWRFGLVGDLGTSTGVQKAGFKGRWQDWAVFALASFTVAHREWELEPHAGIGITHSSFDGSENSMIRSESATLAAFRGGVWVRRRVGEHWSVGGALDIDTVLGTPAYPKLVGNGEVFAVPYLAVALGLFVAADVGR